MVIVLPERHLSAAWMAPVMVKGSVDFIKKRPCVLGLRVLQAMRLVTAFATGRGCVRGRFPTTRVNHLHAMVGRLSVEHYVDKMQTVHRVSYRLDAESFDVMIRAVSAPTKRLSAKCVRKVHSA